MQVQEGRPSARHMKYCLLDNQRNCHFYGNKKKDKMDRTHKCSHNREIERDLDKAGHKQHNEASKQDWSQKAEVLSLLRSPESIPGQS